MLEQPPSLNDLRQKRGSQSRGPEKFRIVPSQPTHARAAQSLGLGISAKWFIRKLRSGPDARMIRCIG